MKCSYCSNQTNTYQKYHKKVPFISPHCEYHTNGRTQEVYTVPNHIPDTQHQLYLYNKYSQFTNRHDLEKLMLVETNHKL